MVQRNASQEVLTMDHPKEDVSTTKRALLKAGWVAPLIVAISLPPSSLLANSSGGNNQGGNQGD
jgi:hypothetical protein